MEGLELKIERIRANLKQWQLASEIGISQNRLSQFELGRQPIPPDLSDRISGVLNGKKFAQTLNLAETESAENR